MKELIEYYAKMKTPSIHTIDIHEHLDTLLRYTRRCEHITEMGFRGGVSFTAFLLAQPQTLITYDLQIDKTLVDVFSKMNGRTTMHFNQANTLDVEIEKTDLLFIDTLHNYNQLHAELFRHGNKASKYIIMHDTETFGMKSEDGSTPGLLSAIEAFTYKHPEWVYDAMYSNNNGLTILRRV